MWKVYNHSEHNSYKLDKKFRSYTVCDKEDFCDVLTPHYSTGNMAKSTRIPNNNENFVLIQDSVGLKRSNRQRVTSTEVLGKLIQEVICTVKIGVDNVYDKFDYSSAVRGTQRFLKTNGFVRGKRTGTVKPNLQHIDGEIITYVL